MIYLRDMGTAGSSKISHESQSPSTSSSSSSLSKLTFDSKASAAVSEKPKNKDDVREDEVDVQLYKLDGRIQRKRDEKL